MGQAIGRVQRRNDTTLVRAVLQLPYDVRERIAFFAMVNMYQNACTKILGLVRTAIPSPIARRALRQSAVIPTRFACVLRKTALCIVRNGVFMLVSSSADSQFHTSIPFHSEDVQNVQVFRTTVERHNARGGHSVVCAVGGNVVVVAVCVNGARWNEAKERTIENIENMLYIVLGIITSDPLLRNNSLRIASEPGTTYSVLANAMAECVDHARAASILRKKDEVPVGRHPIYPPSFASYR